MNYLIITYSVYIILTILLTIWVGKTLFINGRIFLLDIFSKNEELVDSINKLLLIGFYLINFGYVLHNLAIYKTIRNAAESIEMLSLKIGFIVIVLGVMHFINLIVLFLFRSRSQKAIMREMH